MNKSFYKLKRFYIPCVIFIIILAVLAKLLYSPLYTIYWEANHRFEKKQEFRVIEKMTLDSTPKDMIKIVDDYQPKLKDFKDLNAKMQKAIFDFKVAKLFGFEDRYYKASLQNYAKTFYLLVGNERIFFRYLNLISNLNSSEKQKYLSLRASTKDLEKQIFKEELNFIKHYDDFYNYLESIGYLDKGTEYKNAAIYLKISILSSFLLYNNQLCSFENRNLMFNQIKRSYTIFINLDPDGSKFFDKTLKENFRNYRKDISPFLEDTINKIQKALDECK